MIETLEGDRLLSTSMNLFGCQQRCIFEKQLIGKVTGKNSVWLILSLASAKHHLSPGLDNLIHME